MGDNSDKAKYDFFISFANDAKGWVYGVLVSKLGRTGKTFVLMGDVTGNAWLDDLQANIEASEKILVVVTPQYCTSQRNHLLQLMAFTKGAERREWPVVPLLLKSVDLELFLRFINGINLTQYQNEDQLDALLEVSPPSSQEEDNLKIPPYPGMASFKEEDASRFFGREDEINCYVNKLRNEQILVLTGASGCGKSSLARAGIIPQLKSNHDFLAKIVRPIDKELDHWLDQLSKALESDAESVQAFLFSEQPTAAGFVLLIDQFEELFTADLAEQPVFVLSDKAKKLLSTLAKLRKCLSEFYLLVTLRAEFFPQLALCQPYINFDHYLQRVNALNREGLSLAITKPALKLSVFIDECLVERLVNDAGDDPGILPFVQETMCNLWHKRIERYIDLKDYVNLGGEGVSGLRSSIATKSDAAYKNLPTSEHRDITKRIFIRLVQFGEGKPDTRRQQSISDLRSDQDTQGVFEETLRHLSSEKYRLLTVSRGDNNEDSKVDIVHEALIKAWPMLRGWIKDYKELEEKRRIFYFKLKEWQRFGETEAGLLDCHEIKEIKEVFGKKSNDSFFLLNHVAEVFLEKSIRRVNPNWDFKGLLVVSLLLISFLFLIAYLLLLVEDISSYVVRLITYCIFGILMFIIFYFYYYLRKDEPFFEKKITNRITKNYKFTLTVVIIFIATFFLWSYEAYGLFSKHKKCDYLLSSDNDRKNVILNFSSANTDKNYLDYMKIDIEKYSKLFLSIVVRSVFDDCNSLFDYGFIVQEKDLKTEISFSIFNENDELLLTTEPKSKEEKCYLYLDLGNTLARMAGENVLFGENGKTESQYCSTTINTKESVISYIVGDNEEAAKRILENIAKEPNSAFLKDQLAIVYLNDEKMFLAAFSYAKEAVAIDPKLDYINNLAKACRYLHRYDCAEENLKKSLVLDEKNPKTNNQMALTYRDRGLNDDLKKALEYIEKALLYSDCKSNIDDNCYAFKKNRGTIFFELKDIDKALADFESLNNKNSIYQEEIYYYLYMIYKEKGMSYCGVLEEYLSLPEGILPYAKYRREKMELEKGTCF